MNENKEFKTVSYAKVGYLDECADLVDVCLGQWGR